MKSKNLLLTTALSMLLCLASVITWAQARQITGTVTDVSDGSPIPGVNVYIKGTTTGTVTDFDGNLILEVSKGETVVFSFIGYLQKEVQIANQTKLLISLEPDVIGLEEIVVIGYGETKKKDLTGSVEAISSASFNQGPIASPQDLLTGKVAGVNITSGGGAPGSGQTIRIRGGSSLKASNDPLIIIDGFPIESQGVSGMRNPLNTINPNDIETFTVLKDASATAIYGSRASNGVIIITTKKGKQGALSVEYSGNVSVGTSTDKIDVLSGDQYRTLIEEQYGKDSDAYRLLGDEDTDWQEELMRTSVSTNHNISIAGTVGDEIILPYRASVGYNRNEGILRTSSMERITGALNLNPKFFDDHLNINLNAKAVNIKNRFADTGSLGSAIGFDPTQPLRAENRYGNYFTWMQGEQNDYNPITLAPSNPLASLNLRHDISTINRFIANAQFDYRLHFLPELNVNLNIGIDRAEGEGDNKVPTYASWAYNSRGSYNDYEQTKTNKLLDLYAKYGKELPSIKSKFDIMAGYSWQHFKEEEDKFSSNAAKEIGHGISVSSIDAKESYLVSFFGRLNYSYNSKYLFTFTMRNDGSSKLAEKNRWGLFPSLALAWNIDEEPFLKNLESVSQLKLRTGWGITGQQDITGDYYAYLPKYTIGDQSSQYVYFDPNTGKMIHKTIRPEEYDENLKWEETTTYNVGLDYGLFNDRVYGKIDVYYRETEDLINTVPVSSGSNLSNELTTNVGNLTNQGVEFSINSKLVETQDLNVSFGMNFTYNKTEITKLTLVDDPDYLGVEVGGISGGTGNTVQIHRVGDAPNSFYVFEQIYDENDRPIEGAYVDRDGNGIIDNKDKYIKGDATPDYLLGVNTAVSYKNWTFSASGRASFGQYVYNNITSNGSQYLGINSLGFNSNRTTDIYETSFQEAQYHSDYYVQRASFFRLDNIMLGYNFNDLYGGKVNARVFATVSNVFVISPYDGLDPEVQGGIDNNVYPRPRTYMLGVNLSF